MPHPRQKRAVIWAAVALLLCLVPLAGRVWLQKFGAIERPNLGVVGEFVIRDERGEALTRDQLRRSVTLVVFWPATCREQGDCLVARSNVSRVVRWVKESLEPGWTEEKNPLNLIVVGEAADALQLGERWRRFSASIDPGTLIPAEIEIGRPHVLVVDNVLQFAVMEDLENDPDLNLLGRVLSKASFDQYLGNYLSRRTFMGPKRTQN